MYIVDIEALKQTLRTGTLPQPELVRYLLSWAALAAVDALPFPTNRWDHIGAAVSAAVAVGGILHCYRCNGGDRGRDFAGRFFSIGFVLGVRFVLAMLAAALVVGLLLPFDVSEETTRTQMIAYALLNVWYYMRLGDHFRSLDVFVDDVAPATAVAPEA